MRVASPRRAVVTAIASLAPLLLAVACSTSSSSTASIKPEKADITVGATPTEGNVALYLALSRGIFAAHGLHVKIVIVQSTPVIVPSMESGQIDVAAGQIAGLLAAQAQGRAFKVLAAGLELKPDVNEIVTLKSSGITSLAGLKGKTILVNAPIGDDPLLTDAALATVGIKPAQVRYLTVAFPAMSAALTFQKSGAAYCTQPFCEEIVQQDSAVILADLDQGPARGLLTSGYTATAAWAKKYPRTAAAFSAAIVAASRLADANPALVRKTVGARLAMPARVTSAMPIGTFPAEVTAAKLRQVENLMLRSGQLTRPVDVTSLLTP